MRKKAVQQGRSERRGESYSVPYVEPLSDARTPLADFFRILLGVALVTRQQCKLSQTTNLNEVNAMPGMFGANPPIMLIAIGIVIIAAVVFALITAGY
jgi:hypothetical protein